MKRIFVFVCLVLISLFSTFSLASGTEVIFVPSSADCPAPGLKGFCGCQWDEIYKGCLQSHNAHYCRKNILIPVLITFGIQNACAQNSPKGTASWCECVRELDSFVYNDSNWDKKNNPNAYIKKCSTHSDPTNNPACYP